MHLRNRFLAKELEDDRVLKKISVIVPVYKGEATLERCVQSIMNSTYQNIEVILVDDGSPDQSGILCDSLASKEKRIISLHKENGGQASARNYGLDYATGDYITFVDDDDEIAQGLYERLANKIEEEGVDIAGCATLMKYPNGTKVNHFQREVSGVKAAQYLCDNLFYQNEFAWGTVWNKLFKKDLWGSLRFPDGCELEDYKVIVPLFIKAGRVYFESEPLYYWHQTPLSQSKRGFHPRIVTEANICDFMIDTYVAEFGYSLACDHLKLCLYYDILYKMFCADRVKYRGQIITYCKQLNSCLGKVALDKKSSSSDHKKMIRLLMIQYMNI